jgi:chromosome segregation ATPase
VTVSKPYDRAYDSKGFDVIEGRVENDHSKVFTEDMGVIDSKYFEESGARSPKHNSPKAQQRINREAQLMKQVSQLQLELQDCRTACKRHSEEMDSLRRVAEERNREMSLHRDRANVYWEKANDKEQQVNSLKEMNSDLKTSCGELSQELKRHREGEMQWRSKEE